MEMCIMCASGLPSSCVNTSLESNQTCLPIEQDLSPTKIEEQQDESEHLRSSTANGSRDSNQTSDDGTNRSRDIHSSRRTESRTDTYAVSSRRQSGKSDRHLKDQQSTGRKRAARMYPLNSTGPCEWQGYSNCGGGPHPILGCISGLQQARHHGPDKSVSNNEPGNVHRICHYCHNRWHAANNMDYDWNSTEVLAHDPKPMTDTQKSAAVIDEMRYLQDKDKRSQKIED